VTAAARGSIPRIRTSFFATIRPSSPSQATWSQLPCRRHWASDSACRAVIQNNRISRYGLVCARRPKVRILTGLGRKFRLLTCVKAHGPFHTRNYILTRLYRFYDNWRDVYRFNAYVKFSTAHTFRIFIFSCSVGTCRCPRSDRVCYLTLWPHFTCGGQKFCPFFWLWV
jgi:hypothetical protein